MRCTKCKGETQVKDSRLHPNNTTRRRRACVKCGYRFSTSEVLFVPQDIKNTPQHSAVTNNSNYRQQYNVQPPGIKPKAMHHREDFEPSFESENMTDEELEAAIYSGRVGLDG